MPWLASRIVIRPEMHEEEARLFVQHMIMQGGHLDAVLAQRAQDRIDLGRRQYEVPGDCSLAAAGRLKIMASADPIATGTSMPSSLYYPLRGAMPT